MACRRCGGLVVVETVCDLCDWGEEANCMSRCVNCGCIDDPVICANCLRPFPPNGFRYEGRSRIEGCCAFEQE
jgi:hypothetical protein